MTSHVTSLRSRETIAWGTMAFHFARPTGFAFKPGQAIDLVLSGMVGAMRTTITEAGIDEDDIRGEEFYGY